jgi:hypothetical protein
VDEERSINFKNSIKCLLDEKKERDKELEKEKEERLTIINNQEKIISELKEINSLLMSLGTLQNVTNLPPIKHFGSGPIFNEFAKRNNWPEADHDNKQPSIETAINEIVPQRGRGRGNPNVSVTFRGKHYKTLSILAREMGVAYTSFINKKNGLLRSRESQIITEQDLENIINECLNPKKSGRPKRVNYK